MNKFQVFDYGEQKIRVAELFGQLWFSAHDVATVLGYNRPKDAIAAHVEEEDQRILQRGEIPVENYIPKSALPVTMVRGEIPEKGLPIVSEMGLCSLIMCSSSPNAKKFKQWVFTVLIPSMRCIGSPGAPGLAAEKALQVMEELMQTRAEIADMKLAEAQREAEKLRQELEIATGTDEASERKRAQGRERMRRFRERQKQNGGTS